MIWLSLSLGVILRPFMNVRKPVRVARGICCLSSKGALSQLPDLSSSVSGESFDRQEYHKRVEKTERISLRPLLYHVSLEPRSSAP